jgi:hypothetical protein
MGPILVALGAAVAISIIVWVTVVLPRSPKSAGDASKPAH